MARVSRHVAAGPMIAASFGIPSTTPLAPCMTAQSAGYRKLYVCPLKSSLPNDCVEVVDSSVVVVVVPEVEGAFGVVVAVGALDPPPPHPATHATVTTRQVVARYARRLILLLFEWLQAARACPPTPVEGGSETDRMRPHGVYLERQKNAD